jgi:sigma-B regulation protein RsbU (phosphoserine phosphatase)
MFITLFYAELDSENDTITYVNAGHNPHILYQVKAGRQLRLSPTGMAAGVEGDSRYQ